MKRNIRFIIMMIICVTLLNSNALEAQCRFDGNDWVAHDGTPCPNAIITAVPFLRIIPDARGGGLGDAGMALTPDANSMHYNASNLAFVENDLSISATYSPWLRALGLKDVYLAYLTGYKQIDDLQTAGFGLRYFSLGRIAYTDENGEPAGEGRPNEFEIAGAYARKLSDNFSAALALKFIYSNLAADQSIDGKDIKAGTAGAADISFTYNIPFQTSDLKLALALSNLGTKISYTEDNNDYLPANLGIGLGWKFNLDDYNTITFVTDINKLLVPTPIHESDEDFDADGNNIPDYKEKSVVGSWFSSLNDAPNGFSEELKEFTFSVGAEYWYDNQFAVRAGYFYENPLKGNRKFLTLGLGLKYNIFGINLSYLVPSSSQRNPLDNTLRFSLIFDFESSEAN
jgi:hypothetical protein